MVSLLRKLFGKPSGIEQLARGGDREAFLHTLGKADIFVFAAMEGDGLDPSTMTRELGSISIVMTTLPAGRTYGESWLKHCNRILLP